jgi:hypothetical protein
MNLDMEKIVNFNMVEMFLCENTLHLDFENGLSTIVFGPP